MHLVQARLAKGLGQLLPLAGTVGAEGALQRPSPFLAKGLETGRRRGGGGRGEAVRWGDGAAGCEMGGCRGRRE